MKTLKQLQDEWRQIAGDYRADEKERLYIQGFANGHKDCADSLSPFIAREEQYRQVVEAAQELLAEAERHERLYGHTFVNTTYVRAALAEIGEKAP